MKFSIRLWNMKITESIPSFLLWLTLLIQPSGNSLRFVLCNRIFCEVTWYSTKNEKIAINRVNSQLWNIVIIWFYFNWRYMIAWQRRNCIYSYFYWGPGRGVWGRVRSLLPLRDQSISLKSAKSIHFKPVSSISWWSTYKIQLI